MKLLISILLIGLTANAQSLTEVDEFLLSPSFEDSFATGDHAVQYIESCVIANFCDDYDLNIIIQNVSEETAHGVYQAGSNVKPRPFSLNKSDWQQLRGNMLRLIFTKNKNLGQQSSITSMGMEDYSLPNGESTNALRVFYEVKNANGKTISADEALLVKEYPGYAQLAEHIQHKKFPTKSKDSRIIKTVNRQL